MSVSPEPTDSEPLAPPTSQMPLVPPPAPPVDPYPAAGAAPAPSTPGVWYDPLVLAPGSSFEAWYNKVLEIAKRSWRAVLLVTAVGISLPVAIVELVAWLSYGYFVLTPTLIFSLGDFFSSGTLILGALITAIFAVGASYLAAAGWAAAAWTVTKQAAGEPVGLAPAMSYGLKRASQLWVWTVAAGLAVAVGFCLLILPGVYLVFAFCVFGYAVIFERSQNPLARSFKLTHADLGPTLARVVALLVAGGVYSLIVNVIIGAIQRGIISNAFVGFDFSFGSRFGLGLVAAIGYILVSAPVAALWVMGLMPVYAELRARETQMSTAVLRRELGD